MGAAVQIQREKVIRFDCGKTVGGGGGGGGGEEGGPDMLNCWVAGDRERF